MGDRGEKEAFVTLATNDTYALGCLVLANALRKVGTSRRLVVMVTPGVTPPLRDHLVSAFNVVFDVNLIDSQDERNLSLLGRPDLNVTFTKLHCWRLTQFQKAVFLDADTLVLQNIDELFDREELSAAPDAGWPDCFNSGVFVFKPSEETYTDLLQFALSIGSFDGGDQGLLNLFFHDWATKDISKHLPFLYNVVSQAFYSYLPAFTQFRSQIKVVHFIGPVKPWNHPYNVATRTVSALPGTGHNQEFLQCWWNIFMESVQPRLDPSLKESLLSQWNNNSLICFESNLLRSPPSHPPLSNPEHGHEDLQQDGGNHEDQPTSYQVLYPYAPPAVEHDFYIPFQPQHFGEASLPLCCLSAEPSAAPQEAVEGEAVHDSSHSISAGSTASKSRHHCDHLGSGDFCPQVIDMPVISRPYHPYETHYSEEPLTSIDPDSPPPVLYESSRFENTLIQDSERKQVCNGEVISSGQPADSVVLNLDGKGEETLLQREAANGVPDSSGDGSLISKNKETTESTGLVGELALLTISGGETVNTTVIDARERRLAWERGQADYLGVDSFDNIKKKLDEKLTPLPPPPPKRRQSASPEKVRKPSTEHEVNGPVAVETLINELSPSFSHADSEKVVEDSLFTSHTADMSPSLPEALQVLQTSVPEPEKLEPVKKSFDTEMKIEAAVEITASPHSTPLEEPKFIIQPSPILDFQPDKADVQMALILPTPAVVSIKPSEKESEREVEFTVGDTQSETAAIVTLPSLPKSTVPVELPSSKLEAGSDETTSFSVSLPEPSSVSAPKIQTVEKKALGSQQRPAPLQIQKRPPPPVPEKPTSPLVSAGVKSPPPVPQKPTFPTSPGVTSSTSLGVTSTTSPGVASVSPEVASTTSPGVASPTFPEVTSPTSPGGAKQPPPPVAAKPTSPPVAGSFLAQRSIFEKPGTTVTKPVATGILAQKSLFEKPGSAITKPVATGILAQRSLFEKPGGTSDPKLGSAVSAASSRFQTPGAKTAAHPLAASSGPKPSSISPIAASVTSPTSTPSSSSTPSSTSTASSTSAASPTSIASSTSSPASSSASSLRGQVSPSKNKNEEFLSRFGLRLQKK